MLKQRLVYGILMIVVFTAVVAVDHWLGPLVEAEGTILCLLIAGLVILAQLELAGLVERTGARVFKPIAIAGSLLLATGWYLQQIFARGWEFYLFYVLFVLVSFLLTVFLYQAIRYGTSRVITNCGANFFSIFYVGLLMGFVLGIRIEFGALALLMFVFVVKSADIGAYIFGRLWGRRKFSPIISPGKTWEGMGGAVVLAAVVSSIFASVCGIMPVRLAVIFGVVFAFIGQFGDLAESMIKRDAEQKDAADKVPGFGGILDVIDSPLAAAPFAYLFFLVVKGG